MSQSEAPLHDRRIPINYEVPLTWLMGCVGAICTALVYAGWNAQAMVRKLDDAVEVGKLMVKKHEETSTKVLELTVQQKLTESRVFLVESRTDRLEQKK